MGSVVALLHRIAALLSAKRYLEIGVDRGATFLPLNIEHKEAVDPSFKFDYRQHQSDHRVFFEMPSDAYFALDRRGTFDLIYLDGLHTFEQTLRDFVNSTALAHDRTVWLFDDTEPSDCFSVMKSQSDAMVYRKIGGSRASAGDWHGDVFKVIFAIHDFFPAYSFISTRLGGKSQTIVFKARRREFTPLFNDLEAISRMSYVDSLRHKDVLNWADGFAPIEAALCSTS